MGWYEVGLIVVILAVCLCPPKWDPAIRWKEYQMGIRKSFFGPANYD